MQDSTEKLNERNQYLEYFDNLQNSLILEKN